MSKAVVITLTMILLMSTSALALFPQDSQGAGDSDDPAMIHDGCRVLTVGDSMTMYIGVNWNSFINPSVSIESWTGSSPGAARPASNVVTLIDSGVEAGPQEYGNVDMKASASRVSFGTTDSNGIYSLTLTATGEEEALYYKFRVTLEETIASLSAYQDYYYAVYVKAVDEGYDVVVKVDDAYTDTLAFDPDVPYQTFVKAGDTYDDENYYFYATGLPSGINMRLDGIIEGKASGSLMLTSTEGDAVLYAISKSDSTEVHSGSIHYSLVPRSSFEYSVDGGEKHPYFEEGYVAMSSTQSIVVTIHDAGFDEDDYEASLTMDGTMTSIDIEDGTITLNGDSALRDYTGVLQLHIVKTAGPGRTYESTLHLLVAGPIVHSGLAPSVTSA